MVFFTCNACGQAVKKNQVEKHYTTKCRNCTVLSCIDCGKEFWGDEYQSHVKCITENEKYGARDLQPKPTTTKKETKQNSWLENIKNYMAMTNLPHKVSALLNNLLKYDNIPRKKQQFQNFLNNSVCIRDRNLSEEIWDIITKANQSANSSQATENKKETDAESKPSQPELGNDNVIDLDACSTETVKHKKKRNKNRNEEMEGTEENNVAENLISKKKRKHKEMVQGEESVVNGVLIGKVVGNNNDTSKKSKKHKKAIKGDLEEEQEHLSKNAVVEDDFVNGDTTKKRKKKKRKSEGDVVSTEIDDNAQGDTLYNMNNSSGNNCVQECSVENTDEMDETPKKKKKKKHRKDEDLTENILNGNESSATKEQEMNHKNRKNKVDKNHVTDVDNIEEITENAEYESQERVLYKKKKKCK